MKILLILCFVIFPSSSYAVDSYKIMNEVSVVLEHGSYTEKLDALKQATDICPMCSPLHIIYAEMLTEDDPSTALTHYEQASCVVQKVNEKAIVYAGMAKVYAQKKQFMAAEAFMNKAVEYKKSVLNEAVTYGEREKVAEYTPELSAMKSLLKEYQLKLPDQPLKSSELETIFNHNEICLKYGIMSKAAPEPISAKVQIHFDTGKYDITSKNQPEIHKLGKSLNKNFRKIQLVGHADERGDDDYNQRLSEKRAEVIKQYLIENYSIAEGQISAKGRGEKAPLFKEKTLEAFQANRRVEVFVRP